MPVDGPALLLFYHGALPVDYYFLVADTLLNRGRWEEKHEKKLSGLVLIQSLLLEDIGRLIQTVADKFLFSLPGFRSLMWAFQVPT